MWMRALGLCLFAIGAALLSGGLSVGAEQDKDKPQPKFDDTYVPTADEVIFKMFELAKIKKNDVIFDLGCGDNRILYMAAKKFGTRGVGIELNPERIKEAMDQFEKFNKDKEIGTLVEVRHGDALRVKDIGDATVVMLYMFPGFMNEWFPIAKEKLKPGTRIVSHDYSWEKKVVPDCWEPTAKAIVKSASRDSHEVFLWIVPEKTKK